MSGWGSLKAGVATARFIAGHPLNRNGRAKALLRWLSWQAVGRLAPGPVVMDFVGDTKLLIAPGMTGATGNLYVGLHEFEEMAFVLHALRAEDLFADVGANVGSYTVLAAGAAGARCVSLEPVPKAFDGLRRNVDLNGLGGRVRLLNVCAAAERGSLEFTMDRDCTNHVLTTAAGDAGRSARVQADKLDALFGEDVPALMKIDVEGYETEVLRGAARTLADPRLRALIVEINHSCRALGFAPEAARDAVSALGFQAFAYRPFARALEPLKAADCFDRNIVYVRDLGWIEARLRSAPRTCVHGVSF